MHSFDIHCIHLKVRHIGVDDTLPLIQVSTEEGFSEGY